MFKLFLRFEFGKIKKYFSTRTIPKVITAVLGLLVFIFIGVGIYSFFVSGFKYINVDTSDDIRAPFLLFINELFLVVLASIITFSALISSVFNLFRGEYNNWVISSSSYKVFPTFVLIRSILTSLFPLLVVFLPMMLALIKAYHLPSVAIISILFSTLLLLISINLVTLIAITVIGLAYYSLSRAISKILFTFKGFISLIIFSIVILVLYIWRTVKDIDLVYLFRAEDIDSTISITTISDHFNFLPTHILAIEIMSWQNRDLYTAVMNLGLLLCLVLVLSVVWRLLSPLFYPLWLRFQEGTSQNPLHGIARFTYQFRGTISTVIFKKEALILLRNWKGILWFLFFSSLWLAQIGANIILGHNIQKYQPDISQKIILLQVLQYIIAIYFISSFTLRFVFPSFSTEKKTSWILGTAPIDTVKIFFGKYIFYFAFLVTLGIVMSYINIVVLGVPLLHAIYSLALFVATIIFIVTFGISLGALFPNQDSDDPEIISTSMPGLFFTALSLLYGASSDWILCRALETENFTIVLLFMVSTLIFTVIMLQQVPKRINKKTLFSPFTP